MVFILGTRVLTFQNLCVRLKGNYIKIPELSCKSEELRVFTDYLNEQRIKHCRNLPEMLQLSIDGIKSEDDDLQLEHLTTLKSSIQQHFSTVLQTLSGFTTKDLETEGKSICALYMSDFI